MNNRIYFATIDNDIVDNYDITKALMIVYGMQIPADDLNTVRLYASQIDGVITEIEEPSVEMFLKCGHKIRAVKLYYDQHPDVTLKKAKDIIDEMEQTIRGDTHESMRLNAIYIR